MSYDGGYYLIRQPLIRGGLNQHTAANPKAVSDHMLTALNIIQASPWSINRWARDLMREAWTNGDGLGGVLPSPYDDPMPAEIPDEVWANMPKVQRAEHKYLRARVHESNARSVSKRLSFLRKINVADKLNPYDDVYFPHFMDFRGRMYPLPQDLHPQGDDIAKALLMFHEAKPLGERGMYWLEIRLANTFGMDKLSFEDRIKWVRDNQKLIADSYTNPLDGDRMWTEAEEPWSFLVTAREWHLARHTKNAEDNFLSHLPIPMDG